MRQMMEATFTYTPEEFVEGHRAWAKHLAPVNARIVAHAINLSALLLILLGVYFAYSKADIRLTVFCFVYGVFVAIYYNAFAGARLKRAFHKDNGLHGEMSIVLNDQEMKIRGTRGESKIYWHAFSKSVETPNLFVLSTRPRVFYMIPKRALAPGDLDAVRVLLAQKVARST